MRNNILFLSIIFLCCIFLQKESLGTIIKKKFPADTILVNQVTNHDHCEKKIIMSKKMLNLWNQFIELNHKKSGIKRYSVQIYLGSSRSKARQITFSFQRKYPDIKPSEYDFISPNWKVRVGNFRTKLEAEKVKNMIKDYYPNCFIVEMIIPLN